MKEIKFLLTMFWGASLAMSWMLPILVVTSTFEMIFLVWAVPIVYSIFTISPGIAYIANNWNKPWGVE